MWQSKMLGRHQSLESLRPTKTGTKSTNLGLKDEPSLSVSRWSWGVDLLHCRLVIFVSKTVGLPDTKSAEPAWRSGGNFARSGDAMEAPWGVTIEMLRRVEVHLPCSDGLAIEAWQVDSQGVHNWNFKICQASNVATGHPPFSGDAGGQDSKKCHQF